MVTMSEYNEAARIAALAAHLGLELEAGEELEDYITAEGYADNAFDAEGGTYLVLTDQEADAAAREYIKESLWAFTPSFLASHTDLPEEVFSMIQAERSEDANPVFYTLVTKLGDFNEFCQEAISADGRGHFLAQYDGEENEEGDFYIFRTN